MSPDRMRIAADHLRLTAECLRASCTIAGKWDDEHTDERKDCEEMQELAAELEQDASARSDNSARPA